VFGELDDEGAAGADEGLFGRDGFGAREVVGGGERGRGERADDGARGGRRAFEGDGGAERVRRVCVDGFDEEATAVGGSGR
jgi:hypothetical protein